MEPLLERVVVPAVDALATAGALDEANALLERLRADCARVDAPVPPSVSLRLTRLARTLAARPDAVEQGEGQPAPGQEFVGRRDELAALFRALERARAGASSSVAIFGPAGIGKSRLLDEFEARLRARGARVVRVRFLGGMRTIPFAALGEVVRALSAMPGALGVSEETAGVLVGLLPELRAKFAGAPPRSRAEDALVPAHAQALADLIAALCEDGALVLLCDDDQHLDEPSRQVLDAALARRAPRLCVVRASRQSTMPAPSDETVIDLGPLTVADVGGLLGDARDADPLATRLQQATGGIPQMVFFTIRALIAEHVLRFADGRWGVEEGALDHLDAIAPPLVEQVRALAPEERLALRTLALWRRPIAEEELRQLLRTLETGVTDASWRHAISALEGRGFVMLRLDAWVPAHDLVVDAIVETSTPEERDRVLRAFALLALPAGPPAIARMEHVMQVFGAQDALAPALLLLRVAAREPSVRAVGLRGRALAARLAVVSGRAEWRPAFDHALGWWGRRRSRERVLLAVAGTVCIGVSGWLLWMLQPRLVVESVPMMNAASPAGVGFVVQPRVGMYDGFGRSITWLETVVRAEANVGEVTGDPLRRTEQGRAQFERLSVPGAVRPENGSPGVEFRFSGPWWLRPVRVHPTGVVWENQDTFRLIRASVDGTPVPPDGEISITTTGDSLLVVVTFEFSATYATANYVVGATPTWGDPRRSGVRLAGLPRPVRAAWQTVGFRVARPATPGRHHIIFAMDAEGSAEHVLSQTNWTAGEPVWGDGNDLAMLPPSASNSCDERARWRRSVCCMADTRRHWGRSGPVTQCDEMSHGRAMRTGRHPSWAR